MNKPLSDKECDLLMVRPMVGHAKKYLKQTQRKNIFHSRCLIMNRKCTLIVDGGIYSNVTSQRMVDELKLSTIPYSKPYKLQWLNEDGELQVTKQVLVSFSILKFRDELCDVMPMETSHLLLGRPWKNDINVIHHEIANTYFLLCMGHKMTLKSLSHKE